MSSGPVHHQVAKDSGLKQKNTFQRSLGHINIKACKFNKFQNPLQQPRGSKRQNEDNSEGHQKCFANRDKYWLKYVAIKEAIMS